MITSKQRAFLRSIAAGEDTIFQLGKDGISDNFIKQLDLALEKREIKNEKTIIIFTITDFTDTIVLKIFAKNEDVKNITAGLKPDNFIKVKGVADRPYAIEKEKTYKYSITPNATNRIKLIL